MNAVHEFVCSSVRLFGMEAVCTLVPGYTLKMRNMASSAANVLPDPVGAPSNTL